MRDALAAIAHALKDVFLGKLTLLAILNLVVALSITVSAAYFSIQALMPLIPEREGWMGALYNASEFVAGAGVVVLAAALSPAVSMVVGGVLFDVAAARIEKAIGAPPARNVSIGEGIGNGVRIALPALLLNLLALPLLFIPVVNAFVFYGLNGFLMGREYSTVASARRLTRPEADALRRKNGLPLFLIGLACSVIPFVAPLVAASAMTRFVTARTTSAVTR